MVQKRDGVLPHDASCLYIALNTMIHTKRGQLRGAKENQLLVVAKQTVTTLGSRLYIARVR